MPNTEEKKNRRPFESDANLSVVFENVRFESLSEPLGAPTGGERRHEFSGPFWYVAMGGEPLPYGPEDPEPIQRVETSGLHDLRSLADRIREEETSRVRKERSLTPVLIPSTLPAAQVIKSARRPSWVVPSLAGGLVVAASIALIATFWPPASTRKYESARLAAPARIKPTPPEPPALRPESLAKPAPIKAFRALYAASKTIDVDAVIAGATRTIALFENGIDTDATRSRRSKRDRPDDDKSKAKSNLEKQYAVLAATARKKTPEGSASTAGIRPESNTQAVSSKPKTLPPGIAPAGAKTPSSKATKPVARSLPEALLAGPDQSKKKVGAAGSKPLPKKLSPEQIAKKLGRIRRRAGSCLQRFGFYNQFMRVHVVVRGATGRVSKVKPHGRFAGTPVGACVRNIVQRLRLPRFSNPSQTLVLLLVAKPK